MNRQIWSPTKAGASLGGLFWIVVLFVAAMLISAASRPVPAGPAVGGVAPSAASTRALVAQAAAEDPFEAKCVRTSNPLLRAWTDAELKEFDERAAARGGAGTWLVAGEQWAAGQHWIGSGDPASAIAAYGGKLADGENLDGTPWMTVERDGKLIGVSLYGVELPSGLTLWAPYQYRIPVDCPPGA